MTSKITLLIAKTKYSPSQDMDNYYIINYLSIALIQNSRSKKKSNNLLPFPAFIFLKIILSLTMTGH